MADYPGGHRALVQSVVVDGKLYAFGGSHPDPTMRSLNLKLSRDYGIRGPYGGVPNYRDAYRYEPTCGTWTPLRRLPFPIFAGHAVAIDEHRILLMGNADYPTHRVSGAKSAALWTGYSDRILCYDIQRDNYYHIGVMAYGVGTSHWVYDGTRLYSFGGEPAHGFNINTENVLQIGTVHFPPRKTVAELIGGPPVDDLVGQPHTEPRLGGHVDMAVLDDQWLDEHLLVDGGAGGIELQESRLGQGGHQV